MRIDQISAEPAFQALQQEWNATLQQSTSNTIFLTWQWVASWWAAYGKGKQLLILVARDPGGACLGIAPLCVDRSGTARRSVRFLGDGTFDSDYLDFIVVRGHESAVVTAFLDQLTTLRKAWDLLQMFEIPQDSPNLQTLRALEGPGGWFLSQQQVPCGIRRLPKTWDEFLGTLRPRFRTTVRACLRNMEQLGGSFEVLDREEQTQAWLHDLFVLHSGRWALRQQSGVFRNDEKREFYHQLTPALLRRGWLHMTRWRLNGVVLACQFGFAYQGTYYLLQEGFDAQCNHVSPGITLRAATIRNLIAEGIHTYDFLGGIGRHKTDWGAQEKTSWRLTLAPNGISGYVQVQLPAAIEKAKTRVKSALPNRLQECWRAPKARDTALQPHDTGETPSWISRSSWKTKLASALYHTGLLRVLEHVSRSYELRRSNRSRLFSVHRALGPKSVILCYHRVGTGGAPLYSELEPEVFEAQMRYLSTRYRVVSLDTLCEELVTPGETGRSVAVTFDDGYRDVYTHAFPVLQRYKIPATIFLTAGAIESGEVSWYDKIFLALSVAPNDKLDLILDKPRRFLLSSSAARLRAAEEIISWLRTLADEERKDFCCQLDRLVPVPAEEVVDRMLSWEQIQTMHQAGISFGSHTLSHPSVSRLGTAALDKELRGSKSLLEERLGVPAMHFAYPFGKPADYTNTEGAVARCGFRTASTTVWGVNTPGVNAYALFRVSLGEERHLAMFGLKFVQLFMSTSSREGQPARISAISGDAACSSS